MTTAKRAKVNLEFLLVKAEMKGIPEKGLLRSRKFHFVCHCGRRIHEYYGVMATEIGPKH